MKKYFLFLIPALALIACNKEADLPSAAEQPEGQAIVLKAAFDSNVASDGDVKSTVSETGIFAWSTGDAISVNSDDGFKQFDLTAGEGTNQGTFTNSAGGFIPQDVAVFPANLSPALSGTALTVTLPDTYVYSAGQAPTPMIAKVNGGTPADISLSFKHIGALVAVTYNYIPTNAAQLVFTATGKNVSGDFVISDYTASGAAIETQDGDGSKSTVTITGLSTSYNAVTLYIPIPTGNYTKFVFELQTSAGTVIPGGNKTIEKNIAVERADLLTLNASGATINTHWSIGHTQNYNETKSILTYNGIADGEKFYACQMTSLVYINEFQANPAKVIETYAAYASAPYWSTTRGYLYNKFHAAQQYAIFMIGLNDDGTPNYKYQVRYITPTEDAEASEAYNKWLGTWTASGNDGNGDATSYTLTITKKTNNDTYNVKGWKNYTGASFEADFDRATGNLLFKRYVLSYPTSCSSHSKPYMYGYFGVVGSTGYTNNSTLATASLTDDTNATVSAYSSWTTIGVYNFHTEDGSYCGRYYNPSELLKFPFTLTKQ